MSDTVAVTRAWFDDTIHTPVETHDTHWRHYHRMKHMERRLVAIGRADIVEEADRYADERMGK
jgi:hypothetical protein